MKILVRGKSRQLYVFNGQEIIVEFPCAIGKRGLGKEYEGDQKTPLGTYQIKWMIANQEIIPDQTYCILDTQLFIGDLDEAGLSKAEYRVAQDEKLWADSYGGVVMALDYPNQEDQDAGRTGSCIEIHGSPAFESDSNYRGTLGCIALTPEDARKVYALVKVGDQVEIVV